MAFLIGGANTLAVSYATNSQGIFAFGYRSSTPAGYNSISNTISNTGVCSSDVGAVGTVRGDVAATEYGGDKGIFFGGSEEPYSMKNLVNNSGVVASDSSTVGTARQGTRGCTYGDDKDKGLLAFGHDGSSYVNMSSKVSNSGVVSADITGVGTARGAEACEYGGDKGI